MRVAREPASRPLSAATYLLRNPRRVVPVALVQTLVTALLMTVITPTNAFETTSEAYLRVMRDFSIVTPVWRSDFDEELMGILDKDPGLERREGAKTFWMRTPMIVGEAYTPLIAVDDAVKAPFLENVGDRLVQGKLPEPGTAGAAIHRATLRATGLSIGDRFGQAHDPTHSTPGSFEVVGELEGEARVGIVDLAYASDPESVLARQPTFQVVYAKPGRRAESDRYLREAKHADGRLAFRVVDEDFVRSRVATTMQNLPLVLGFVTGAVALIAAFMTTLLNRISFQSRAEEFGLLMAVGHRRGRLAKKLAVETILTSAAGWLLGMAIGYAVLVTWQRLALDPKGILMNVVDARPIAFSAAVPILSCLVSTWALAARLRRMDPVSVIQRRGT